MNKWHCYLIIVLGVFGTAFILFPTQWPWILIIMVIFFGVIVGAFIPLHKEKNKESYITGIGYWDPTISKGVVRINLPIPPLISDFDKIPNAAKLVEEYLYDKDPVVRSVAAEAMAENFDKIPNAGKIIEKLANYKYARSSAVKVLIKHFDKIPNAGKIIEILVEDEDKNVRADVVRIIKRHFDKIPNAKRIIERLVEDKDEYVRIRVADVIKLNFDKIPNAGKMLEKLAQDENEEVRNKVIRIIKEKWNYPAEIYRDKFSESFVKKILSETESGEIQMLRNLLSEEINEKKAREISNLTERILSEYRSENKIALCEVLLENFYIFPNAKEIIEKLMEDLMEDHRYRGEVAGIVSRHFEKISNTQTAQKILEIMANNDHNYVRWKVCWIAAKNIGRIPNALSILEKLKNDKDEGVRYRANKVLKERYNV